MYQLPSDMMNRMIRVPLATKSPCAHNADRPYGLSMVSLLVVGDSGAGAAGAGMAGAGAAASEAAVADGAVPWAKAGVAVNAAMPKATCTSREAAMLRMDILIPISLEKRMRTGR